MVISSQIVFWLLSSKLQLTLWEHSDKNKEIWIPMIYRGQDIKPGRLYIVDELADLRSMKDVEKCAFLMLLKPPYMLPDHFRRSDVAFVQPHMNKLDLFDEVNSTISALLDWVMQLKDSCNGDAPVSEIMSIGSRLMNAPLCLYDGANYREIVIQCGNKAQSFSKGYELFLDNNYKSHLKEKGVYEYPDGPDDEKNLYKNIFYKDRMVAVLVAGLHNKQIHEGERQVLLHLSEYLATSYLDEVHHKLLRKRNEERYDTLVRIVFAERPQVTMEMLSLLARFNWKQEHTYHVVVLQEICEPNSVFDFPYLRNKLEGDWRDSCLLSADSRFVWVVNITLSQKSPDADLHAYIAGFIGDHILKAGASEHGVGFEVLSSLYKQACFALIMGQEKYPNTWMFAFKDFRLEYVLEKLFSEFPAEDTIHPGLAKLIAYDKENAMDYVGTLGCYIDNQFRASVAAEKLFVHRSTFLRRLERIAELSGITLKDPDEVLHVMISLRICEKLKLR